MGIDGMRVGGGRCPPLIVAGLLVACFLLVCNWWSLSAENSELLRQIDGLSQQLKLSAEQRDQCVTLRGKLEERYKGAEEDVAALHLQLGQEKESLKSKDEAVVMCNIELDSLKKLDVTKTATVETLRLEKETINGQLEEKKEDNKKLQDELDKLQEELNKLRLTQEATWNKKSQEPESPVVQRTVKPHAPQLGPVPEGAVEVSPSGQQGIKHYGIPVLPPNPPGAVRQSPRFSVTMLKAGEGGEKDAVMTNDTQTGSNYGTQQKADAVENHVQSNEGEEDMQAEIEDEAQPQDTDQGLKLLSTEPDVN